MKPQDAGTESKAAVHGDSEKMPNNAMSGHYVGKSTACSRCGSTFRPSRSWQRFCGAKCRNLAAYERRTAGKASGPSWEALFDLFAGLKAEMAELSARVAELEKRMEPGSA